MKESKGNLSPEMYKFWVKKTEDAEDVILSSEDIKKINEKNYRGSRLFDLNEFAKKKNITNKEIMDILNGYYSFNYVQYISGEGTIIDKRKYEELIKNMNIRWYTGIKDKIVETRCGVMIERSDLKKFPTDLSGYKNRNDKYDRFVESALYFGERVIALNWSTDRKWILVLSRDYIGWVKSEHFQECSREEFCEYSREENILISLSDRNFINLDGNERKNALGSRIKYISEEDEYYICYIPFGEKKKQFKIYKDKKLSKGYMTFNKKNIFKLAFEMLGQPYSWGGSRENRDCSSFVRDIYRCFNLIFHRNSSDQKKAEGFMNVDLSEMDIESKIQFIVEKGAGFPVYLPGHVMIVLGDIREEVYIIHASGGYFNQGDKLPGGVVVTSTEIENKHGKSYMELIDSMILFNK